MADTGPDTILLDLFRTNQVRERLIEASLAGLELPPEDYPFYVLIGAEGPWTPTLLVEYGGPWAEKEPAQRIIMIFTSIGFIALIAFAKPFLARRLARRSRLRGARDPGGAAPTSRRALAAPSRTRLHRSPAAPVLKPIRQQSAELTER